MRYHYYDEWGVKRVANDSVEGDPWLLGWSIGVTLVAVVLLMIGGMYALEAFYETYC